jgi:colanic acid/amylovoran biosynthesis protein
MNTSGPRAVTLIAPAGAGSRGDEAMLCAIADCLRQSGPVRFRLCWLEAPASKLGIPDVDSAECLPAVGRDAIASGDIISTIAGSTPPGHSVYLCGADVLDGHYSVRGSLLRIALVHALATRGVHATIVGFSLNDHVHPFCAEAMRQLPPSVRLCVRDPVSVRRAYNLTLRNVIPVADAAFLLKPQITEDTRRAECWIEGERSRRRAVVAVNVSVAADIVWPGWLTAYVRLLETLSRMPHRVSFILFSHDIRFGQADEVLLHQILQQLSIAARAAVYLAPSALSAAEIKQLCGKLDLVLTHRMHLAIAALGMGTPALALNYQGKVEGLYQLFNWPSGLVCPWLGSDERIALAATVCQCLDRLDELRTHLLAQLPRLFEMSLRNVVFT